MNVVVIYQIELEVHIGLKDPIQSILSYRIFHIDKYTDIQKRGWGLERPKGGKDCVHNGFVK
jgi:hypothetical protein